MYGAAVCFCMGKAAAFAFDNTARTLQTQRQRLNTKSKLERKKPRLKAAFWSSSTNTPQTKSKTQKTIKLFILAAKG
jgi:hypothetical protein